MDEPAQDLGGRDLIVAVREILVKNPERHDQAYWVGNYYLTPDELMDSGGFQIPLDEVRPYAMRPIATEPEDSGARWPVCGTIGCVAGWAGVLAAPPGSTLTGFMLTLPDGEQWELSRWVARRMGISQAQAAYLFSPNRSRERLIRLLDALAEDPDANLALVE